MCQNRWRRGVAGCWHVAAAATGGCDWLQKSWFAVDAGWVGRLLLGCCLLASEHSRNGGVGLGIALAWCALQWGVEGVCGVGFVRFLWCLLQLLFGGCAASAVVVG